MILCQRSVCPHIDKHIYKHINLLFYLLFSWLQTPPPINSNYQLSCQAVPIHCNIAANKCSITATTRVSFRRFIHSLCLRYPGCLPKQEEYVHSSLKTEIFQTEEQLSLQNNLNEEKICGSHNISEIHE